MTQTTAQTASTRRPGRRRRVLAVLAAMVVLFAVGYLVVGIFVYDRLSAIRPGCNQTNAANSPATFSLPGIDTAQYAMPDYQPVTLPSRDPGVAISAWYVPAGTGELSP